jgi:hypothetical protein
MIKAATVVLVLALASSANGMVYGWTDSAGIKHFTNRRDEIPERYRSKAKPLYPEQADLAPAQQNAPPQQVTPVIPPVTLQPAVQQHPVQRPAVEEPPKTPPTVVVPATPPHVTVPATGRKIRPRPVNPRDE